MQEDLNLAQSKEVRIAAITQEWLSPRWEGIARDYTPADVERMSGTLQVEHTLATQGAKKFWHLLHHRDFVPALGAMTGNQAVQQVTAGLEAIYVSGWQVAADANAARDMYPDQSIYPSNSGAQLVEAINNALRRRDYILHSQGEDSTDWYVPLVADAEAGFGGTNNVFEVTRWMIEAGASAIHFEDQSSKDKKCGHMAGKVLISTADAVKNLKTARLSADILGVPTVLIARTDADGAKFIEKDIDPRDQEFLDGTRTPEGFYGLRGGKGGVEMAIARGIAFAPYADVIWCETSTPDMGQAEAFAKGIHAQFPDKLLAYNCSPSFNWQKNLNSDDIARFQRYLAGMGYRFQFVTLAGFHTLNLNMFVLAKAYAKEGMSAYVNLVQAPEFAAEADGYTATKHQAQVGAGYYDGIAQIISEGQSSTTALTGSTEEAQF